jgi:hypothetical protein
MTDAQRNHNSAEDSSAPMSHWPQLYAPSSYTETLSMSTLLMLE